MKKTKLLLLFLVVFAIFTLGCGRSAPATSEPAPIPNANTSEPEDTSELVTDTYDQDILDSPGADIDTDADTGLASDSESLDLGDDSTVSTAYTPTTGEALITVEYATDEILNSYESVTEFIEFDDEGYQKIIIRPTLLVKDFAFVETGFEDKDNDIIFHVENILYSLDELTAAEPFVVTWMGWGAIPHRGISFLDENNVQRYFHIIESGMDGSVLLAEFLTE